MPFKDRRKQNKEIFQALTHSGRVDFPFDRGGVKARLLLSIASAPQAVRKNFLHRHLAPISLGAGALGMIIVLTGSMVYADTSAPGDNLYFLNLFQEKLVLSLPLPAEQKADLRFGYAYQHVNEVSQMQDRSKDVQIKTLKQSQASILDTIDKTVNAEQSLRQRGKTESAENLSRDLSEFQAVTDQHVKRLEALKQDNRIDQDIKNEIDEHLAEIKNARQRARQELQDEFQKDRQTEKGGTVRGSKKD